MLPTPTVAGRIAQGVHNSSSATRVGLELQLLSDLEITVDGRQAIASNAMTYQGMIYSGIPNMASSFRYTNASWTLKCDLTCEYICRLLNHMESKGYAQCMPVLNDSNVEEQEWIDFSSGYIQRSIHEFPKQGSKAPWKVHQNYALDVMTFRFGKLDDGSMVFKPAVAPASYPAVEKATSPG